MRHIMTTDDPWLTPVGGIFLGVSLSAMLMAALTYGVVAVLR